MMINPLIFLSLIAFCHTSRWLSSVFPNSMHSACTPLRQSLRTLSCALSQHFSPRGHFRLELIFPWRGTRPFPLNQYLDDDSGLPIHYHPCTRSRSYQLPLVIQVPRTHRCESSIRLPPFLVPSSEAAFVIRQFIRRLTFMDHGTIKPTQLLIPNKGYPAITPLSSCCSNTLLCICRDVSLAKRHP